MPLLAQQSDGPELQCAWSVALLTVAFCGRWPSEARAQASLGLVVTPLRTQAPYFHICSGGVWLFPFRSIGVNDVLLLSFF